MRTVEATINYLGEMAERPRYHAQDHAKDNLVLDPRKVRIADRRGDPASLGREGFELVPHKSAIADFRDEAEVARIHNREIEELLLSVTGADRVVVTGKGILRFGERSPDSGRLFNSQPARFIHIDISDATAREFADRSRPDGMTVRRFAHYNVWRVISDAAAGRAADASATRAAWRRATSPSPMPCSTCRARTGRSRACWCATTRRIAGTISRA